MQPEMILLAAQGADFSQIRKNPIGFPG